jgi:hypothetical protein
MKTLAMMRKKNINELSRKDKIAVYLQEHPEALTEETMITVAARFMNYSYIRLMIREIYQKFIQDNLVNDNFVIIENYNE